MADRPQAGWDAAWWVGPAWWADATLGPDRTPTARTMWCTLPLLRAPLGVCDRPAGRPPPHADSTAAGPLSPAAEAAPGWGDRRLCSHFAGEGAAAQGGW